MHRGGLSEKRCSSLLAVSWTWMTIHILGPQFPYLLKVRVGLRWCASPIPLLEQQNAFLKQYEKQMTQVCGIGGSRNSVEFMLLCHLGRWISSLL